MRRIASIVLLLGACQEPHEPQEPAMEEPRWLAVEGLEDCAVERLEPPTIDYASTWSSCGAGCRMRAAVPSALAGDIAERGSSAAQEHDGALFLRTSISGDGSAARDHRAARS